jgi:pyrimidine 5'-nucleotidase
MKFSTLFFDLDDTLYPSTSGLWDEIRRRIDLYMQMRLGIPTTDIPQLRKEYINNYGTTLRGLQTHNQVDSEDFLSFVHDIPVSDYLQPDEGLRVILQSLPQSRWVFTNADAMHAERVLEALDLTACFHGIVDITALAYESKPDPQAFMNALKISGAKDPCQCMMFDDSPRNLKTAKQLGFYTVLVSSDGQAPGVDARIDRLVDLPSALPMLWM